MITILAEPPLINQSGFITVIHINPTNLLYKMFQAATRTWMFLEGAHAEHAGNCMTCCLKLIEIMRVLRWFRTLLMARDAGFFLGFLVLCFPVSLIFCFSASLLFCFSALLLCFSCFSAFLLLCFPCFSAFPAFPASLLFCFSAFPASLLFCFSVFPASLLLYFCAFLLLLFYFFFSSVMCFCCSTSCSFASLLPVFTVSLFFIFFCFILFCLYPKWNPRETLGETQRNPKEILIRNPTWSPLNEP